MATEPMATRTGGLSPSLQWQRWIPLNTSDNWKNNPGPTAGWINYPKKLWPKQTIQQSLLRYPIWNHSSYERALPTGRGSWYFNYRERLWTIPGKVPMYTLPDLRARYSLLYHPSSPPGWLIHNQDMAHRSVLFSLWRASWPPAIQTLIGQTTFVALR